MGQLRTLPSLGLGLCNHLAACPVPMSNGDPGDWWRSTCFIWKCNIQRQMFCICSNLSGMNKQAQKSNAKEKAASAPACDERRWCLAQTWSELESIHEFMTNFARTIASERSASIICRSVKVILRPFATSSGLNLLHENRSRRATILITSTSFANLAAM